MKQFRCPNVLRVWDIEGAEMDALRGIAESDWRRVRQLAMEVSPGRKGSLDELIAQLRARGFARVTLESFTGDSIVAVDDPTPCMLYTLRPTPVWFRS